MDARSKDVGSQRELLALVSEGKTAEAKAFLNSKVLESERNYVKTLSDMVDFQSGKMDEESKLSQEESASARNMLLSMAIAAIVLAVVVTWLMIRSLYRQLGGEPAYATDIVRSIASGDLSVNVETKNNDNQSLLFFMKAMQENLAKTVGQIRQVTDTVATASNQMPPATWTSLPAPKNRQVRCRKRHPQWRS